MIPLNPLVGAEVLSSELDFCLELHLTTGLEPETIVACLFTKMVIMLAHSSLSEEGIVNFLKDMAADDRIATSMEAIRLYRGLL